MNTARDASLSQVIGVIDLMPCGAALFDRSGRILHANARLESMTQHEAGALVGRNLRDMYAGDEAQQIAANIEDFETAREGEFFLPLPNGKKLPVMVSGGPLRQGDTPTEYRLVTLMDISELKAMQEHCQEQYREITQLSDTVLEQALHLKDHARVLEQKVRQRTRALHEANMAAITMLAVASEQRDSDTGAHVQRIRDYSEALAREIGLSDQEAEHIGYSAILHDVGKIQVPDDILKKPGPLTPEQREQMKGHTLAGEHILSDKSFFDTARAIARSHHENWDGSGYPDGLGGEEIPLAARIVHLADVFDALASKRVYKPSWPPEDVIAAIRDGSGTQFDPRLVDAFRALVASGAWAAIGQRAGDQRDVA